MDARTDGREFIGPIRLKSQYAGVGVYLEQQSNTASLYIFTNWCCFHGRFPHPQISIKNWQKLIKSWYFCLFWGPFCPRPQIWIAPSFQIIATALHYNSQNKISCRPFLRRLLFGIIFAYPALRDARVTVKNLDLALISAGVAAHNDPPKTYFPSGYFLVYKYSLCSFSLVYKYSLNYISTPLRIFSLKYQSGAYQRGIC